MYAPSVSNTASRSKTVSTRWLAMWLGECDSWRPSFHRREKVEFSVCRVCAAAVDTIDVIWIYADTSNVPFLVETKLASNPIPCAAGRPRMSAHDQRPTKSNCVAQRAYAAR